MVCHEGEIVSDETSTPGTQVDGPGSASGTATEAPPEPPKPEDLDTQPFGLLKHAAREARRRRRVTRAALTVKRPKAKEFRLELDRDSTVIGRDARCDIVIDDAGVSRRHARIDKTEVGYFELVDLSSTNGTLVDGRTISNMLLLDGDRFVIGDTRFTLHVTEQAEEG